ncbi:MAG: PEP-CTERM sorting domain-containing protein [Candidatus Ancaeobacter aquaticus]|nr:PEP-CTERM sorting domain-containing protein [Candidatus Ancaeobacter aquaticus]
MKKLFILISMAVFVGITSPLYAITITEDFSSYGSGTIINGSGGDNWGTNWTTGNGSPTFVGDDGAGKLTASSAGDSVYRAFNTTLTSIYANGITIKMKMDITAPWEGIYGGFQLVDSNSTAGIYISFVNDGNIKIRGLTGVGSAGTDLATIGGGYFHTVTITEVDFDNNQYKAKVDSGVESEYIAFYAGVETVSDFQTLSLLQQNDIYYTSFDDISISNVPEPSTYALFGIGLLGFFGGWIRKKAVSCKH